jgi:hypothetical protein
VLCDKANCRHSDKSCGAWYEFMFDATGFAMYGDRLYVVQKNAANNSYDLVSMDVTGNDRKVVRSLDIGDYTSGAWVLSGIERAYYFRGAAVLVAKYAYIQGEHNLGSDGTSSTQILEISLSDGTYHALNELSAEDGDYTITVELVSDEYIIFEKQWSEPSLLAEAEFEDEVERGGFPEFSGDPDPYYRYTLWHQNNCEYLYLDVIYDRASGEFATFDQGKCTILYEPDGQYSSRLPKNFFGGGYAGDILYGGLDFEDKRSPIYRGGAQRDESDLLFEVENGGFLLASNFSGLMNLVVDRERLLYCKYKDDGMADIYEYSLNTGEHAYLYTDKRNITFRLIGESSGKYIGKMYSNMDIIPVYAIDKDAYNNGNFSAAKRCRM